MKKIMMFLILTAIFAGPVFCEEQERKIEIFGSVLGAMADPGRWSEFSCINPDGTLNEKKYREYMKTFAKYGASATRELPFLVHDDKTTVTPNYMPWKFANGKYDLERPNERYYANLRKMAQIANENKLVFYFSMFDNCHGNWPNSPWKLNHQGVNGWYDRSITANNMRIKWIYSVLPALEGTEFGIELANEPYDTGFYPIAVLVMEKLKDWGVPYKRIIVGFRYMAGDWLPEKNPFYRGAKNALKGAGYWNKKEMFSKVLHKITPGFFQQYTHIQKHNSKWFITDDGCHPKWGKAWESLLTSFFKHRSLERNKLFMTHSAFEHVYRHREDNISGVFYIAKAVENSYGVKLYSKVPDEPETPDKEEPQNYFIKILTPTNGEKLKVGETRNILWESNLDTVKIQYSTDAGNTWIVITEGTKNNGEYLWTVPNTPCNDCMLEIGFDNTSDTENFEIKKKKRKWYQVVWKIIKAVLEILIGELE